MTLLSSLSSLVSQGSLYTRLDLSLLHFLWEGTILLLIAAVIARIVGDHRPVVRHNVWLTALLLMAAAPVVTFLVLPGDPAPVSDHAITVSISETNLIATPPVNAIQVQAAVPEPAWKPHAAKIVAVYFVGVALMLVRTALGLSSARSLRRSTEPVTRGDLLDALSGRARALGMRIVPPLLHSARVATPCVIGVLKPAIVLPTAMLNGLPIDQIAAILSHELAHIRRCDHWISLFQRLIEAVLFFHPAIWIASRRLSAERELCCDDVAVASDPSPQSRKRYADALVRVAEIFMASRQTGALNAVDRPTELRRRISRLLEIRKPNREFIPRRALAALTAPALIATALIVVMQPAQLPAAENAQLAIHVLDDKTGQPLPNAALAIRIGRAESTATTDATGSASIDVPSDAKSLSIIARSPAHIGMGVNWRDSVETPIQLPKGSFTLRLPAGTTIGGLVNDESGKPVSNAAVKAMMLITFRNTIADNGTPSPYFVDMSATTGPDGRWTCDTAPAEGQFSVHATHPDFCDESHSSRKSLTVSELHSGSSIFTMLKGFTLAGTVIDSAGKPVGGAKVSYGKDAGPELATVTTAADGKYRFEHGYPKDIVVAATAKGLAPAIQTLKLDHESLNTNLTMRPSKVIQGRVVGPDGNPVVARVNVEEPQRGVMFRSFDTTADGRFEFDTDGQPLLVNVGANDAKFMGLQRITLTSGQDNVIKLARSLHVSGTITDGKTGQAVAAGRIVESYSADFPIWQTFSPPRFQDGKYSVTLRQPGPAYLLRFEADGYTPVVSRVFGPEEGDVTVDVKLSPAAVSFGQVVDAAGKPVANAQIAISGKGQQVMIENGELMLNQTFATILHSGADGTFSPPAQENANFRLLVLHDSGFASVSGEEFAKSTRITLQPWASIEGDVKTGSKPVADAKVHGSFMQMMNQSQRGGEGTVHISAVAKTDADGHFRMDRVVPAQITLQRGIQVGEHEVAYGPPTRVDLKLGETAHVVMGGGGRSIAGHIAVPKDFAPDGFRYEIAELMTKFPPLPKITAPANVYEMTEQEQKDWLAQRSNSDEGKATRAEIQRQNALRKYFPLVIAPDGSFTAEDVAPGEYKLQVRITAPATGNARLSAAEYGLVAGDVTIPHPQASDAGKPLDIGTFSTIENRKIRIGDVVPQFTARTLDGQDFGLEKLRGRYVVLHLWSSWSEICMTDLPQVEQAASEFAADTRVAFVGMNYDATRAAITRVAAEQHLTYPQALLGGPARDRVPKEYDYNGPPSIWLIGPDGKLISTHRYGADVKKALRAALNQ